MSGIQVNALQQKYLVNQAATKYGVPYGILAGVYGLETTWGQNPSTSSAGAIGPFQFLPSTAASYGYPLTNNPTPQQFAQQVDAAAHYLSDLFHQTGSWDNALRHYSGGGYGLAQVDQKAQQLQSGSGAYSGGGVSPSAALGTGAAVGLGAIGAAGLAAGEGAGVAAGAAGDAAATDAAATSSGINAANALKAGSAALTLGDLFTGGWQSFVVRAGEAIAAVLLLYLGLHALTGQSSSVGAQAQHVKTRFIPI